MTTTNLMDLAPSDPLMQAAWAGSLHFAIGCDELLAKFRADTGLQWTPATNAIDRMIDEACGAPDKFMLAFVKWHNANVWGEVDGKSIDGPRLTGPA